MTGSASLSQLTFVSLVIRSCLAALFLVSDVIHPVFLVSWIGSPPLASRDLVDIASLSLCLSEITVVWICAFCWSSVLVVRLLGSQLVDFGVPCFAGGKAVCVCVRLGLVLAFDLSGAHDLGGSLLPISSQQPATPVLLLAAVAWEIDRRRFGVVWPTKLWRLKGVAPPCLSPEMPYQCRRHIAHSGRCHT